MSEKHLFSNREKITDLEFKHILNEAIENKMNSPELMYDLIMNIVTEYLPESLREDFEEYLKFNHFHLQKDKAIIYEMGYDDALEEKGGNVYKAGYEAGLCEKAKQQKCRRNKKHIKKIAVVIRK